MAGEEEDYAALRERCDIAEVQWAYWQEQCALLNAEQRTHRRVVATWIEAQDGFPAHWSFNCSPEKCSCQRRRHEQAVAYGRAPTDEETT